MAVQALKVHTLGMKTTNLKTRSKFVFILIVGFSVITFFVPTTSWASSWQCKMQIPKSGSISNWCGTNPVNIRISGSKGSGWIGISPFSLWVSGSKASGWIGTQPNSLWKSGARVTGWVGQSPVNCRVSGKNNFCMTYLISDSN